MNIDLPEKKYYKIGEVAKAFGVNASLIRFWESEFKILKPKKNANGSRLFTQEDIDKLKLIYHLVKEKGFTLEGAKKRIRGNYAEVDKNHKIISRLEKIKLELKIIKDNL